MKKIIILVFFISGFVYPQTEDDAQQLEKIYKTALVNGQSYAWLDHLSNQIGGRLSGSYNAEKAIEYTKSQLDLLGLNNVWLQPVMVPKWVRGIKEYAYVESKLGNTNRVNICALGGSVATPDGGLKANIIEVKGIDELKELG